MLDSFISRFVLQLNRGTVDLEEYIFTVQAIANAETELDLIDIAFEVTLAYCKTDTKTWEIEQRPGMGLGKRGWKRLR